MTLQKRPLLLIPLVTLAFQPQMVFGFSNGGSNSRGGDAFLLLMLILAAGAVILIKNRSKRRQNRVSAPTILSSENSASSLYLWLNKKAAGPFPMETIVNSLEDGQITTQTFARREKGQDWKFLANFHQPENYHIPYCPNCRDYVRPQVVAHNTQMSSPQIAVPVGDYGYVVSPGGSSQTYFTKFCSICGGRVHSQADLDAAAAPSAKAPLPWFETEEENNRARVKCFLLWSVVIALIIGYLILRSYAES